MKKIYVCSALRGDVEENIRKARCYCEYVVKEFAYKAIAIRLMKCIGYPTHDRLN